MSIRVEFHHPNPELDTVMYLGQVPSIGEQVRLTKDAHWRFRVKLVEWDLTTVEHASDYINEVRADVYLEAF